MAPCYVRHTKVAVEEDLTHEFKAHRDLSKLDLSELAFTFGRHGGFTPKVPRRRAVLSKYICGMLNTGLESKIYLGITDDGVAEGFMMSLYQRDHFQLSLRDLLSRYQPPCPDHLVDIKFVPVVDPDEVATGVLAPEPIGMDISRTLEHGIRDARYCWCDSLALAGCANGLIFRFYIIELGIKAWDASDPRNTKLVDKSVIDQRPIFANEFGKRYIRRNGYTIKVTHKNLLKQLKGTCYAAGERPEEGKPFQECTDDETDFFSYDTE